LTKRAAIRSFQPGVNQTVTTLQKLSPPQTKKLTLKEREFYRECGSAICHLKKKIPAPIITEPPRIICSVSEGIFSKKGLKKKGTLILGRYK